MKIYILPVAKEFQPSTISVTYPSHNVGFKDAEELYLEYLNNHPNVLTSVPGEADWHCLPVFWTHWLVDHKFGTVDLHRLQAECRRVIIDDSKTFTIHEYAEQPKVDIGKTVAFLGSRTSPTGIDVPLLCAPHFFSPRPKRYLASFVGNLKTHPIRREMEELFKSRSDVHIAGGGGTDYFVQMMLESYLALCPRGYGGASYRFYEAMQLGAVPLLIGNIDHRPFKEFLDWEAVSFFVHSVQEADEVLNWDKGRLLIMGAAAKKLYDSELANGNWCKYVERVLEKL
jgi:hypothetical protein